MNHQPVPQRSLLRRRASRSLLTVGAIALIATSCAADGSESASTGIDSIAPATAPATAPPTSTTPETTTTTEPSAAGAVSIEMEIDFSGGQAVGTFDVSVGADLLGCASGSFVETDASTGFRKAMACESGGRAGAFTLHVVPVDGPGPGDDNGVWNVETGTEDFAGLQGEGEFAFYSHEDTESGSEDFGGEIRFGPPGEADSLAPDATEPTSATAAEQMLDADFLSEQMGALAVPEDVGALLIAVVGGDETIWAADGTDPTGNAPTPSDPFRVGSISKVFTSLTTLSLADEGLVSLDDPVADHVTRVTVPDDVTVRDLLQHTSGIRNYTDESGFFDDLEDHESRVWSPEEMVELVSDRAPNFPAGTEFGYSNTNYIILGIMIEEITGRPFDEALRARVIDPVGMPNTHLAASEDGREPFGAYARSSGELEPIDFDYTSIETSAWSAGAMISTAEDLHRLFTAVYSGNIVSPDTLAEMTSNEEYGLGMEIWGPEKNAVGHGGGIVGYSTLVLHSPSSGRTAFWVSTRRLLNNPAGKARDFRVGGRKLGNAGKLGSER